MVHRRRRPSMRRPRGHLSGERAGGSDRRAVGGAGAVAAAWQEARTPAEVGEAAAHQRYPVAGAHRRAVEGRAGGGWAMADGVWAGPAVASRLHLAEGPTGPPGPRGA